MNIKSRTDWITWRKPNTVVSQYISTYPAGRWKLVRHGIGAGKCGWPRMTAMPTPR
jgi:hypothetical protein